MSALVWEYFVKLTSSNNVNNKAKCKKCGKEVNNVKGCTSAMNNHMRTVHKITFKRKNDLDLDSSPSERKLKHKTIGNFVKTETLGEIVDELATKDGFSIRGITQSRFIRQSLLAKGYKFPKSPSGTMSLIHGEYEKNKQQYIDLFVEAKEKGEKFSITLDEWVSSRQRRYMNINVHDKTSRVFNLGLIRIVGTCKAEKVVATVTNHLKEFHLSFENDIVATSNDGASVMVKYGRECPTEMQICLNHSIQLAICDTFYCKKQINDIKTSDNYDDIVDIDNDDVYEIDDNEEGLSFNFSEDEYVSEALTIAEILNKVRGIVNFFNSPVRNDILQKKVESVIGHELKLKHDVKHRWNSISTMLETLLKLQTPIKETLEELNASHLFLGIDFEVVEDLCNIMKPLVLTVLALSRKDANLITAKGAIQFLFNKLDNTGVRDSNNSVAIIKNLKENIRTRLCSRANKELNSLLLCLLQQKCPSKDDLQFGTRLLNRLYPNISTHNDDVIITNTSVALSVISDNVTSLETEINSAISDAAKEGIERSFSSLREEFAVFKRSGQRTSNLQKLLDSILTVRPTSTEPERVFSSSSNFSRKLRSRLSDYSLNCLIFLKYYRINKL